MKEITNNYIDDFMKNHNDLIYLKNEIIKAISLITNLKDENKIMLCGNGGSAADCEHIAGELLKSFMLKRKINDDLANKLIDLYKDDGKFMADNLQKGVRVIPLTSFCAFNTAYINDCDSKMMFAQLVNSLGIKNDVLFAISTSGNSKNVIYAARIAKLLGIKIIALTGNTGGQLKNYSDILLNVPSNIVYKIQEYHLPIYHLICLCVESELFD